MKKSLLTVFILFSFYGLAKVDPPNYNFSLDTLVIFYPNKLLSEIKKIYPKTTQVKLGGNLYRTYVEHLRYKFPIFFRVHNGTVISFFARLPTYFLHDVFHQSLINRYGKQDRYKKVDNAALYFWNNEKGIKLIYKGECTITCFPTYLTGEVINKPAGVEKVSIVDELLVF